MALHYYSSSSEVQVLVEQHLEKKAGRNFGPPGNHKLVLFVDDYSLPAVDPFGTQPPVAFLRQHLDYGQWSAPPLTSPAPRRAHRSASDC